MRRTCLLALLAGSFVLYLDAAAPAGAPASSAETSSLFQPPRRPALPAVKNNSWTVNPIDTFILARLEAEGLTPSPRADKSRLLRRVTFDLTGLPPTIGEQEAFLSDTSADAYGKVVEHLLDSPRYGERWAQHWLDLVRYAETDGFKADDPRPSAHRYRDYVIAALNADLPYDRFVRQQLAGDELEPDNPQALIATGFLRLWPDEYNAANLEQRRQEILDDVTDVTGQVFLGMTFGCARCHDHKYDPILQTDYFRLQAFFAPMRPRDDLPAATPAERRAYQQRLDAWQTASRDLRAEMDKLAADKRREQRKSALGKFRTEIQQAVLTPDEKRTPYQRQIAFIAEKQLRPDEKTILKRLPPDAKKRYQELEQKLSALPSAVVADSDGRHRRGSGSASDAPAGRRRLAQTARGTPARFSAFPRGFAAAHSLHYGEENDGTTFRPGSMADAQGQSADGARVRQSFVAASFRRRHRRQFQRLRADGRCRHAPGIARLAGCRVRREGLEPQTFAPADGSIRRLLSGFASGPR